MGVLAYIDSLDLTRKYFDLRMRSGDFWSLLSQQGPLAKLQVEEIRDPILVRSTVEWLTNHETLNIL